jgi:hypothetical protein
MLVAFERHVDPNRPQIGASRRTAPENCGNDHGHPPPPDAIAF